MIMRKRMALSIASIAGSVTLMAAPLAGCGTGDAGSSTTPGDSGQGTSGGSGGASSGASTGSASGDGTGGDPSSSDAAASAGAGAGAGSGNRSSGSAGPSSGDAGAGSQGDAGGSSRDAGSVSVTTGCKRGIASDAAPSSALAPTAASPGVSWWYNWAISGSGGAPGIEFVPMVWGSSTIKSALPAGAHYVLGFNEPNFKAQSDLSPQQAVADWPDIEAHAKAAGIPIVSPAVNYCGSSSDSSGCTVSTITDPYTYLKDFFAACAGCEVDAIAVHWYNCDLPSLKAYIEGNPSTGGGLEGFVQFGKPIWFTEFSCGGSSSVADQTAYMKAAVPYLEGNANIARYSWFSAGPIPNAELMNSDGSLTDLGKTYVSLPQSCR
jgi:hypothetical protein